MARNLIDRLDVAIEYDVPAQDLPDERQVARFVRETLLVAVGDVLDAMDEPDMVLTLPELALDLGEIDFTVLAEQAPARLRVQLRDALADALRRARAGDVADARKPHRVDTRANELAQFADFLASGRLPWHADLARRDLHVGLLARLMDTGPRDRAALLDRLDEVLARTGALRRLVEQFPAAQLAALLALDADAPRAAVAAPWRRTLAAALGRADGELMPSSDAPLPAASSGRGSDAVVARHPADPVRQSDQLAALDSFLRSGRLDHHAVPNDGAPPAHIALLDAVLGGPPAALKTVLRAALAHPDRARRLVEHFAPRQLIALVRVLASGRVAALPTLFAALQEARGDDAVRAESRIAAWLLALEMAVADTSADAVQERIRTLGGDGHALLDEDVHRQPAGGGIDDLLQPEARPWAPYGLRERDDVVRSEGNGGVSVTAAGDIGTGIVRRGDVSRDRAPSPAPQAQQPGDVARHAAANAGDGAATGGRGHARTASGVAAAAATDKSATLRRDHDHDHDLPALPQAVMERACRGHDEDRGDTHPMTRPYAANGGLPRRPGDADTAAVAGPEAAGREDASTVGSSDAASRGQFRNRRDADVAEGPEAASGAGQEHRRAAGEAADRRAQRQYRGDGDPIEGRGTHSHQHEPHRHHADTVAAPDIASSGQSEDFRNAGGVAGTDAGNDAQQAARRDADTIRGPRSRSREHRHDFDANTVAKPDRASGGQPDYRSDVDDVGIPAEAATEQGSTAPPSYRYTRAADPAAHATATRREPVAQGHGDAEEPHPSAAVQPDATAAASGASPARATDRSDDSTGAALAPEMLLARLLDGVPSTSHQLLRGVLSAGLASEDGVRLLAEALPAALHERFVRLVAPEVADAVLAHLRDAQARLAAGRVDARTASPPRRRRREAVPATSVHGGPSPDGQRARLHAPVRPIAAAADFDVFLAFLRTGRMPQAQARPGAQVALLDGLLDTLLCAPAWLRALWRVLGEGPTLRRLVEQFPDRQLGALLQGAVPATGGTWLALAEELLPIGAAAGDTQASRRTAVWSMLLGTVARATASGSTMPEAAALRAEAHAMLARSAGTGDAAAGQDGGGMGGSMTPAQRLSAVLRGELRSPEPGWLARLAEEDPDAVHGTLASAIAGAVVQSTEDAGTPRMCRMARRERLERLARACAPADVRTVVTAAVGPAGPAGVALAALADVLHACARGHRGFPLACTYADLIEAALARPSAQQVERLRARLPGSARWVLRPVPRAGVSPRAAVVPAGGAFADASPDRVAARALRAALATANAMRSSRRDAGETATAHSAVAAMHTVADARNRAATAPGTPAQRRRAERVVAECAALVRSLAQSAPAPALPDGLPATEAHVRVAWADVAALAKRLQNDGPPPAHALDRDGWLALVGAALDVSPRVPPTRRALMLSAIASAAAAHPRPLDCLRLAAQAVARGEAVDLDAIAAGANRDGESAAEDVVRDAIVQMLLARADGPAPASWTALLSKRRALVARTVRMLARQSVWRAALADGAPERMLDDLADAASPALMQAARALLARGDVLAPALGSQWRRRIWRGTLAALDALGAAQAVPHDVLCARILSAAAGTEAAAQTAALAAWRRQQAAGQAQSENRLPDAPGAGGAAGTSGGAGATSSTSSTSATSASDTGTATSARSAPGAAGADGGPAADARTAATDRAPASLLRLPWPGAGEPGPGATPGERIALDNAGIVIAAPYLPRLFAMLALVKDGAFVDMAAAERAVHLVQYLGSGEADAPEYRLSLNKLLCGLPLDAPVPARIEITQEERDTIESLLGAIVTTWSAIGRTSNEGLRQTFLMRAGELELGEEDWHLRVEPGPFDMLMDRLPWGFSIIKFAWMPLPVHVKWR